jgi:hypothetical protein
VYFTNAVADGGIDVDQNGQIGSFDPNSIKLVREDERKVLDHRYQENLETTFLFKVASL